MLKERPQTTVNTGSTISSDAPALITWRRARSDGAKNKIERGELSTNNLQAVNLKLEKARDVKIISQPWKPKKEGAV